MLSGASGWPAAVGPPPLTASVMPTAAAMTITAAPAAVSHRRRRRLRACSARIPRDPVPRALPPARCSSAIRARALTRGRFRWGRRCPGAALLAVAIAAPTMPASLSRAAGTMGARMPVSRGTHLSDCLLMPPPTMIRLGESSASMCCRYSSTRPAHLPQLRSCSSLARSEARFSASWPWISICPNSVFGTSDALDEQRAADPGAEGQHQHRALLAYPGAERHLGHAGRVGVVQHPDRVAGRLAEQRGGVQPDPGRVQVGRGPGHAVGDHAGKGNADRPGPAERGDQLLHHAGHRVGAAGRGVSIFCRSASSLPVSTSTGARLDAGAADVDAECVHGLRVFASRQARSASARDARSQVIS